MIIIGFIIGIVTYVIYFYSRKAGIKGKPIPGPRGLPLVGSVVDFAKTLPHIQFNRWSEQYGSIYKVKLGPYAAVVVSDPHFIKEMFLTDPNYAGRPPIEIFTVYPNEKYGLVMRDGPVSETQRRFLIRQLKDLGLFLKNGMEAPILSEVNDLIARLKAMESSPIKVVKELIAPGIVNSITSVIISDHQGTGFQEILHEVAQALNVVMGRGMLALFLPFLNHIVPKLTGFDQFEKAVKGYSTHLEAIIKERRKTFQPDHINDFIDVFLSEMEKAECPMFCEKQLVTLIVEIFFGGGDSTSATITWTILYLCIHQEVQKKFQQEIKNVTNNSRKVTLSDRINMPYTLALIDEVFRSSSISPQAVMHRALEGKLFNGYYIPKNTWCFPNLHYLHQNKQIWGDPENFRPERFLDADGNYKKSGNLMPFSIGRRQCVGESLARDSIFLHITNLFQRFRFEFALNEIPSTDPVIGFFLEPKPFSVMIKDRLE